MLKVQHDPVFFPPGETTVNRTLLAVWKRFRNREEQNRHVTTWVSPGVYFLPDFFIQLIGPSLQDCYVRNLHTCVFGVLLVK